MAERAKQRDAGISDHECLSPREAARRLGTGLGRVRTLMRRGGLKPCTACGRTSYITVASVEAEEAWQASLFAERGGNVRPEGLGEVLLGLAWALTELIGSVLR